MLFEPTFDHFDLPRFRHAIQLLKQFRRRLSLPRTHTDSAKPAEPALQRLFSLYQIWNSRDVSGHQCHPTTAQILSAQGEFRNGASFAKAWPVAGALPQACRHPDRNEPCRISKTTRMPGP
jgi:hypothetical protein